MSKFVSQPVAPGLHLLATPIGRARDITLTALDLLAGADLLAAEDTRTLRHLMDIHGIALGGRRLVAYHDHSGPAEREALLAEVASGRSVAYASEAGTPLLADPGFALAREAIARGLPVLSAPGPSALLAALSVAGLPTDRFAFLGFLPAAKAAREAALVELRDLPMTAVFYESPKRVHELFASLGDILGEDRPAALCRELTKRFEEVIRGTVGEIAEALTDRTVKGEVVVLVGRSEAVEVGDDAVEAALREAMAGMRVKDAATAVAGALGLPRRRVYQIALGLRDD